MKTVERRDVIRTKKALVTACYELILEQNASALTVNDILERANISRGTFYAHYDDIADLIDSVEDYILDNFTELFDFAKVDVSKENCTDYLEKLFNLIEEKEEKIAPVFNYVNNVRLEYKVRVRFKKILKESYLEKYSDRDASFLSACFCSIVFSSATDWITTGKKISKRELCENITHLLFDGYKTFLLSA